MENNILLTLSGEQFEGPEVRGNQDYSSEERIKEKNIMEVVTPANLLIKQGQIYIFYEEGKEGTQETVKSRIKIMSDLVEVTKKGPASVHMVFKEGLKEETYYYTPFGTIQLRIATRRIEKIVEKHKGYLNIYYDLEVNYEHLAQCEMKVAWEYLETEPECAEK